MNETIRTRRLPTEITRAPLRTVRPVMLRGLYANPEKELVRLRTNGLVVKIAHGTYVAKPDTVGCVETWKPPFEEAAMAYATAAYGDRVPVLAGIGAARHWHAIPRAIGVTVIAVPAQHRPVDLETGGRIIFTVRDMARIDAIPVQVRLGIMRVTRVEQTLIDLILRPELGGIPGEAATAAVALYSQTDRQRMATLITGLPPSAATQVRTWIDEKGQQ